MYSFCQINRLFTCSLSTFAMCSAKREQFVCSPISTNSLLFKARILRDANHARPINQNKSTRRNEWMLPPSILASAHLFRSSHIVFSHHESLHILVPLLSTVATHAVHLRQLSNAVDSVVLCLLLLVTVVLLPTDGVLPTGIALRAFTGATHPGVLCFARSSNLDEDHPLAILEQGSVHSQRVIQAHTVSKW